MRLSLQILFVYVLTLPSLLHPSILFNCFYTCNNINPTKNDIHCMGMHMHSLLLQVNSFWFNIVYGAYVSFELLQVKPLLHVCLTGMMLLMAILL